MARIAKERIARAEYMKEWYVKNTDIAKANAKRWIAENPEAHRASKCRSYAKNAEKILERGKSYLRQYYLENRERILARCAAYDAANPDKARARVLNRRARRVGAEGKLTERDILAIIATQKGRCAYCRKKPAKLVMDHIQSLAKGGSNHRRNFQGLCGPCNQRKHAKDPLEFSRELGLLL